MDMKNNIVGLCIVCGAAIGVIAGILAQSFGIGGGNVLPWCIVGGGILGVIVGSIFKK
jgi:hypothetical protein